MIRLGVNIDHVATVRQARRAHEPDPVAAAVCFDESWCKFEDLRLEVDDKGFTRVGKGKPNARVATAVKKDGKWLIANFHASANLFDNPVLWIAVRRTALWVGGGAAAVGLLLGLVVGRFLRRKRGSTNVPGAPNPG